MPNTEKTYQHFAKILTDLLGNDTAIRLTVNGYMPLSLEHIGQSAEGNRLIAISRRHARRSSRAPGHGP